MSHYCGDVYVAEELAQEALLRACRRWQHVSALDSPEGWVYRVAVNLANSTWRRRRAELRANERHGIPMEAAPCGVSETKLLVQGILSQLSHDQRAALILRYMLGFSAQDAADLLGTTPGAVRARTHRGREQLRALSESLHARTEESHHGS